MMTDLALIRDAVARVADPEIPVVSIADLGILRDISLGADGVLQVTITPTYSGCPAMDAIRSDIADACERCGAGEVEVRTVLSPPWTTDWITDDGRRKLREFGIAPPGRSAAAPGRRAVPLALSVRCPRCGSPDTRQLSEFGSTACKALHACNACLEPFDYFKAI